MEVVLKDIGDPPTNLRAAGGNSTRCRTSGAKCAARLLNSR
jgi:hypothetical protein